MMHLVIWLVRKAASVPLARCAPAQSKTKANVMLCTVQATCTEEGTGDAQSFAQQTDSSTEMGKFLTQLLPIVMSPEWLKCSCLISICPRIWGYQLPRG